MKTNFPFSASLVALACASFPISNALACASCGCTLNSDWENLGVSNTTGFKMDIRYDYLDQNQLRAGTGTISPSAASAIVNNGSSQEVEQFTRNQYIGIGLDYTPNTDWGVNVNVPYIIRNHSTLGTASDGYTAGDGGGQYRSSTSSLGDMRVAVRYQGFSEAHNFGVLVGMKLPTGSHTLTGISTDATAPGAAPIDRGLQPGTGTTDVFVGAYYLGTFNEDWGYYVQAVAQHALNSKDDYKPGDGQNLNLGVRYAGFSGFTPQVQLNVRHVARDSGANADTVSTGGLLAYLSPGVNVAINKQMSIYSYVQVPVYQNVNGVQLAPRASASVGLRYAF